MLAREIVVTIVMALLTILKLINEKTLMVLLRLVHLNNSAPLKLRDLNQQSIIAACTQALMVSVSP